MSYDLFFCTDGKKQIAKVDLEGYFAGIAHFKGNWRYENPDTGLYFTFEYSESDDSDDLESPIPEGYSNIHLSFNMNYLRPQFFAREAMPIVEGLCKTLGLFVVNPQGTEGPKVAHAAELINSWTENNRSASKIYQWQGANLPYFPRDLANNWWRYQYSLRSIEKQVDESIYVPNIFLFVETRSNRVRTAISWTEGIPLIFPNCDMVIIVHRQESKEWLHHKPSAAAIKGWIKADEVRRRLRDYFTSVNTEVGIFDAILPEQSKSVKPIFEGLPVDRLKGFTRIASDKFVDEQ